MKRLTFIFVFFVFSLNASFGNSVANSVAGGLVNTGGIAWDTRVPDQGREYALDAAQRDSNTGAIMAGVTGAALASAATGFFLAGDFATGATLMGMAGMEFAQMAASGRDSNTNRSQRDVLLQQTNPSSQFNLNEEKERLKAELPESLDDFLKKRGVAPEDFKNLLLNGNIQTQQAAMDAVGADNQALTSAELQLGTEKAKGQFEEIFKSAQAKFESRMGGTPGSMSPYNPSHPLPDQFAKKEKVEEDLKKSSRTSAKPTKNPSADFVPASMISNYYGIPEVNFTPQDLSLLTDGFLRDQGILPSRQGRHIFQLANDSYKMFSKTLNQSTEKN